MSQYYTPKRSRNIYNPKSAKPFKLSRSKLELFVECPRCFYIDRRLGTGRPPGFPFSLNSAVDAVPIHHKDLEKWRTNFTGIQYLHEPTNLIVTGAIDDLWQNKKKEFIVVDYKSTSKNAEITALDQDWQDGYKRQMEIYQWLLRQNGYKVCDTGYFVYCNGDTARETFDAKLEFEITLIAYQGNSDWVEQTVRDAHACLTADKIPPAKKDCDYCAYLKAVSSL